MVSVIIPAYNEEQTVGRVIRAAKGCKLVDKVIVVSDGSKDGTALAARKAGADFVYELFPNRGKGGAILHGVKKSKANILVFMDADLEGISGKHLKKLIKPVLEGKKDMNVGLRDRGKILTRLEKHLPLIAGERALRREIIEKIPEKYLKGFMLETALNYYCRSHKLKYGTVIFWGVNMRKKMQKVGILKGLAGYVMMGLQVIKAMIVVRLAKVKNEF